MEEGEADGNISDNQQFIEWGVVADQSIDIKS